MRIRSLFALSLLALVGAAQAQLDTNRVVAKVNGEDIRAGEYYRRMEFLTGVGKVMGEKFVEMPPGLWTIEALITERLLLQLGKDKAVLPTEVEMNSEVAFRMQADPKLLETWKASGRTEAELRESIRIQLIQFKLQTFGVTVTDQEVEQNYNENKSRYTTPKRLRMRVIAVSTPTARDNADKDLRAGVKFADVATKYSEDVTKAQGGSYGIMPITMFSPAFRSAVDPLRAGQSTEWITAGTTFVKFLVEEVFASELQPLTPLLRRQIRREIMVLRGQARNNLQGDMRALRAKAKIDITEPEFATLYRRLLEESGVRSGG